MSSSKATLPSRTDQFPHRHLGPRDADAARMLEALGIASLDALADRAVPASIRFRGDLKLPAARGEVQVLADLADLAQRNKVFRSYLGMGYHDCITPPVIQRGILENPGWYTQYTPYQPEISQGRLEALLNFQTMIIDLTGMEVANASLLDEATAAAEGMTLCRRVLGNQANERPWFLVSRDCHPQTVEVVKTRAEPLGIRVVVESHETFAFDKPIFGALLQYPRTDGTIDDYAAFCKRVHDLGALVVVAADLLALTLLRAPGEFGADVVVGSAQRFGVPMGYGGPHAAFMATREDYKRSLAGRIVGVSKDVDGRPALRLALQTREQHIRREKATSNICTAQVLLAVMASMYGIYHGPDGLRRIAERTRAMTGALAAALKGLGVQVPSTPFFDTIRVRPARPASSILAAARQKGINLRDFGDGTIGIALDETVDEPDVRDVFEAFGGSAAAFDLGNLGAPATELPAALRRSSAYLTHPVFQRFHSETELLRYIHRLQTKDLSLTTSMIPLGSCTMKLNATAEMMPVTWPGFAKLHPFAPLDQAEGYRTMHARLDEWLREITGFAAVSLQPNAGSQGEYAGLLVIRAYHLSRGQEQRNVCLIPQSAHGTNPASAVLAGMHVVVVACDQQGNVDLADLEAKAREHGDRLAALMVTYPSTHGVFEDTIKRLCEIVHQHGGQVYLDGANMNAQVGLCRPGDYGADVCHLNLHKTFCIPHGGGGPGMGPICVAAHLAPFLPRHPVVATGGVKGIGAVSAAPWGSPSILTIPYAYIAMMGPSGLRRATQIAILNANYIARRVGHEFPVLYKGQNGLVAHECILDVRHLKSAADIDVDDVAKRLMDYGFHAPTMSFPVPGTLMVEPTESESKEELDRFCDALLAIRAEVREIEQGKADRKNNVLKRAPHTAQAVVADHWDRPYSREQAAFPSAATREHKFWPTVARLDHVYGDRNLVCACPPVDAYRDASA
ncbi:MAG: aminomethyl-transferring glycine dehydrogenase [Planctomycetota bacterium]